MAEPQQAHTSDTEIDGIGYKEIRTLLDYAARHGLDQDCTIINTIGTKLEEETAASSASPSLELICLYSKLCLITKPVTGRSLRSTKALGRYLTNIARMAVGFLVIAVANESLNVMYQGVQSGGFLFGLHRYLLGPIAPFIWGGLGSCVFLLKRLSDLAAAGAFDPYKLQGWKTRIVLGAILGGIMQFIYDPQSFSGGGLNLDANAVAFITGVGVRVVYGAIEKTVAVLAEKLNLESLYQQQEGSPVVAWLNTQLATTDTEKEPEKRKLILAMIDELNQPKSRAT
ncbi:hypothetical protein ACFL0R_04010 [Pseudomonadota bacterium]